MHFQFVPYLWLSLTLVVLMLSLFHFAWNKRSVRGGHTFIAALSIVILWVIAQAMEFASVSLSAKLAWANLQYTLISLSIAAYFYLAVLYTGRDHWLKLRALRYLLLLEPAIVTVLSWTNGIHGLVRRNVYLDLSGAFPLVGKTYGPAFWAFSIYNLSLTVFTLLLLAQALNKKPKIYRAQILSLFIGLLLPALSIAVYITGLTPLRIDPTPMVLGASCIIIFQGIFRYHLFDIVPIAHSTIIQEMSTGMILFDRGGNVLEINPAARDMLELSPRRNWDMPAEELLKEYPQLLRICQGQAEHVEEAALGKSNTRYFEVSFKQLTDSGKKPLGWIMQIYNINERKLETEKMREAASHDALTSLPNRAYLEKMLSDCLENARKHDSVLALAYLDLDNFKQVNDTYGHDAGDAMLREVACRLKTTLRETDIVSRYGGDEYIILFPSIGNFDSSVLIREKILRAFEGGFPCNGAIIQIRASIGFALYPKDGNCMAELIRYADQAMYRAKGSKRCRHDSTKDTESEKA
ncbi:histidine kinase N-terminal 7TM domain-containing protein [Papillibacter cinnamivorans]|uniref:PAS domain S-box-containing protein/diguanylate cyclase (GGDEF) domain-containing protein n=1 Tax=Papillibacter cinnamivorans DSM 12816 TaxID=1122930 RepID=A0A1W2BCG6_9FIRM|nr:histidine kinase N-terminal 7TM domain-containing protein [Papillibacter cinnamivorans]SMC70068.1 PAS domain S-box-containing protein/diguanylate cyclase (GGDEF) domain-containing protein [Papillibacter cinnamivorans DSM 12816]